MELIIDTADTRLSIKNRSFYIQNRTQKRLISPARVSSIAITANVQLNYAVVVLAAKNDIPISFFNRYGKLVAQSQSADHLDNGLLRMRQYEFSQSIGALDVVKQLFVLKTQLQMGLVKRLEKQGRLNKMLTAPYHSAAKATLVKLGALPDTPVEKVRNTLFGIEGTASRWYFKTLVGALPVDFQYKKRSRRPSRDRYNALLNYIYGCTYAIAARGIVAARLDPYVGLLHVNAPAKNSLVFDLIEPLRPLMDRLAIDLAVEGKLDTSHFNANTDAYWLNSKGKKIVLPAFHEHVYTRVKVGERVTTIRQHAYHIAQGLKTKIQDYVSDNL